MSRGVGGVLDMDAYAVLAEQHRPADTEALWAEVRRLHRSGHSPLWIAEALKIDQRQVARLLEEPAA